MLQEDCSTGLLGKIEHLQTKKQEEMKNEEKENSPFAKTSDDFFDLANKHMHTKNWFSIGCSYKTWCGVNGETMENWEHSKGYSYCPSTLWHIKYAPDDKIRVKFTYRGGDCKINQMILK